MRILRTLADADVGSTVAFNYYSGSTPGARRRVKVETNDGTYVAGTDLDKNEYRKYLVNMQRGDVYVLQEAGTVRVVTVNFVTARTQLRAAVDKLSGEALAKALGEMHGARSARFNSVTGNVELEVAEPTFVVNGKTVTATEMAEMARKALA